jgi:hypothetical protein
MGAVDFETVDAMGGCRRERPPPTTIGRLQWKRLGLRNIRVLKPLYVILVRISLLRVLRRSLSLQPPPSFRPRTDLVWRACAAITRYSRRSGGFAIERRRQFSNASSKGIGAARGGVLPAAAWGAVPGFAQKPGSVLKVYHRDSPGQHVGSRGGEPVDLDADDGGAKPLTAELEHVRGLLAIAAVAI